MLLLKDRAVDFARAVGRVVVGNVRVTEEDQVVSGRSLAGQFFQTSGSEAVVVQREEISRQGVGVGEEKTVRLVKQCLLPREVSFRDFNQLFGHEAAIYLVLLPVLASILGHPDGRVLVRQSAGDGRFAGGGRPEENHIGHEVGIDARVDKFPMLVRRGTNLARRDRRHRTRGVHHPVERPQRPAHVVAIELAGIEMGDGPATQPREDVVLVTLSDLRRIAHFHGAIPRLEHFSARVKTPDPVRPYRQRNRSRFRTIIDHHNQFVGFGERGFDQQLMSRMKRSELAESQTAPDGHAAQSTQPTIVLPCRDARLLIRSCRIRACIGRWR